MSDTHLLSAVSPAEARQIVQACDRFEEAWKARPRPEEYLGAAAGPARSALLHQLLLLDWEYRRRAGDDPRAEDYYPRFPGDEALVADVGRAKAESLDSTLMRPNERYAPNTPWAGDPAPGRVDEAVPGSESGSARYELVQAVGQGGTGVVYRGRDRVLGREVAVKVLRADFHDHPDVRRRFLAEARVSSRLQHPAIVPVYEQGRFADGRPYFAMKLVEGHTLAELLHVRADPTQDLPHLLGVFGQVCQAVAYAHSRGVVHRDLKPANVMVGAFGEVQVMDWGFAKVAVSDQPAAGGDRATSSPPPPAAGCAPPDDRTQSGVLLGTPAYMPPEQARGEAALIDPRSDVFALGAILCEILTGRPPYEGGSADEVCRRAAEGDLGDARARLGACGADAALRALAERCLAPDKADRPADAGDVAAAVAAYVSGVEERLHQERLRREREQVQAAEERRRRKLWMGLAAVVLVALGLLAAGLAVVNHLRGQEQAAKDLAQRHEQETRAVMDELSSTVIDDWLSRQPQLAPGQKEFLKKGLAQYEKFTQDTGETPQGRAALARAYQRVGAIRRQLGLLPEAEEAHREAVRRWEALAGEFPTDTNYQREAAEASYRLAVVLMERGDHRKALPLVDEAIRHQQEAVPQNSGDARGRGSLARLHLMRGALLVLVSKWNEAADSLGRAQAILTELVDAGEEVPDYRMYLADVHRWRGVMLSHQNKPNEAAASLRLGVDPLRKLVTEFPSVAEYKLHLAACHTSLGVTLYQMGQLQEAGEAHGEALALMKALVAEFKSVPRYRQDLASGFNNLALVLEDQGKLKESEAATRQAIALREQLVKESQEALDYAVTLGGTYGNLAALLKDQGRPAESLEWYDKAVKTLEPALAREEQLGDARRFLRNMYAGRAQALDRLGRHKDAAEDWDRAVPLDDGKRRGYFTSRGALSRGDHARAVALAREQAAASGATPKVAYDSACVCALAAAAVPDDPQLHEQYAARAVELLHQAAGPEGAGVSLKKVKTDEALDSLRGRDDFRQLLKELEAKAPAPSPVGPATP
jgi:tetratricopeptide (TPR) repeat protein/tRNA A-37 threonylcarbamoyl transferase component Bud32